MSSILTHYAKFVSVLISYTHKINLWLLMPALLLLILLDITLRNVFTSTLTWSHEVSGLLLLSIFFIDLPYCLSKSEFLKVDLLYSYFSPIWKKLVQKFALLCCFLVSVFIVWQAYVGLQDMIEFDETALTLAIPLWPFSAMIATSGVLMALQSLVMFLGHEVQHE